MIKNENTILIVDDIIDVREGLSSILQDEGYNVITAENGNIALKQLKDRDISLIVTDILMPEMDGMELVTQAKKLYPKIKFIMISGGGNKHAVESSYSYLEATSILTGEKNMLKKPFKPQELIDMVKKLI
jgi:DNA-binding NtrC family response regulator